MRAAAVLRNAAKAGANAAKTPKPMSNDHTLYHLAPTGFWKKFRDAVVVNPEISSGLPLPDKNRYPPPGSRPERYATPATAASDVAFNQYYDRDTRRAYPKTTVFTQEDISELLIESPALKAVSSGETAVAKAEAAPLTQVLDQLPVGRAFVAAGIETATKDALPPLPPPANPKGKWVPRPGQEIPHAPHAYFPIHGVY